jgi:hypothetical protein
MLALMAGSRNAENAVIRGEVFPKWNSPAPCVISEYLIGEKAPGFMFSIWF